MIIGSAGVETSRGADKLEVRCSLALCEIRGIALIGADISDELCALCSDLVFMYSYLIR
jgi:hypothetical protein